MSKRYELRSIACVFALSLLVAATTFGRPLHSIVDTETDALNVNEDLAVERILAAQAASSTTVQNTGADTCGAVGVTSLPANPPGGTLSVTILGDNTAATGIDCDNDGPLWWEAFELTECATVRLDYCGTTPRRTAVSTYLYQQCPGGGTNCGPRIGFASGGASSCPDANFTIVFANLPAGVYYVPIRSMSASDKGPYQINLFAEKCVGACCDFDANTCTDGVSEQQCAGVNQEFSTAGTCCTLECLPPGETFRSKGVELLSWVDLPEFANGLSGANDVWGYASPSGREYAIVGLNSATGFVEVTDPFNPVVIETIPDSSFLWSDMRTLGEYAYNVIESSGNGMQILDMSQIDTGVVTLVDTFTGGGFQSAHNIAINTQSGYAYLCGANIAGGFVVLDLADPEVPVIAGSWNQAGCHDMFVITYNNGPFAGREIAFLFGGGDNFYIIDVTNKSNIFTVSSIPSIPTGFGHQGWITEDLRYVVMGSELTTGVPTTAFVSNVENIEAPFYVNSYTSGLCSTDHNVMIKAGIAYHANYSSGLQVFDITDPTNAQHVAFYDTNPANNNSGFDGAWGIYTQLPSGILLVTDDIRGLFVLNYDCNGNGIDDTIDIANLTSNDCNTNGLPDECERDQNGNGLPDDCEFAIQTPPQPEIGGVNKNRYISFVVPPLDGLQQDTALRVRLTSLHHPAVPPDAPDFTAREGELRYVVPLAYDDQTGEPMLDCVGSAAQATTFKCAKLSCDPTYLDWSALLAGETLHVTGAAVVPSSTYDVAMLSADCAGVEPSCVFATTELSVATVRWGDTNGDAMVNVADVVSVVDAVKDTPGAVTSYQATMQPNDPDPLTGPGINVTDIVLVVDSLKLVAYSFTGPIVCP